MANTRYKRGDHLIAFRGYYFHHGLYLGKNKVLHYTDGKIAETTMDVFMEDTLSVEVKKYKVKIDRNKAIERGLSRVGESNYNLIFNNCEHFVNWCLFNKHKSDQVTAAVKLVDNLITKLFTTKKEKVK